MRTKFLYVLICLLTLHTGLVFTTSANADSNDFPTTVVPVLRVAVLTPTTDAPSNARGTASLISPVSEIGTNRSILQVATGLLFGGVYAVNITDNESNAYTLGTFSVPTFTNRNIAAVAVGQGSFPLPDGLSLSNVVGVFIMDSNAVVDLVGSFQGPINLPLPEIHEVILLAATNDAPVNAAGRVFLDTDDNETGAVVGVEAVGLPAGPYTVTLTDNTGSNTFVLGTLNESPRTNLTGFAQPDFLIFGQSNTTGQAEFPLPDGLTPTNVAIISLIDSDSVIELTGDFTRPTNTLHFGFNTLSPLIPGSIYTNLNGNASLHIKTIKNKAHNLFSLVAQNVPANQTFDLLVNSISVGTVKSNKRGQISLKKLPKSIDLLNVMTIEAADSHSNVVFSVTF